MILATHGIIGSQIVQFTGLLDTYTGAAAAYSLRLLRTAYTGSAIRVRRASDNTEQDIGFSNNELDTTSLTSFCSGTNGFVTTWYDQSGNANNATQSTAGYQPQIVSSGNILLLNNKSRISFQSNFFNITQVQSTNFSLFTVLKKNAVSYFGSYLMSSGTGGGFSLVSDNTLLGTIFMPYNNTSEQITNARRAQGTNYTNQYLENWIYPNAAVQLYQNGNSETVDTTVFSGWGSGAARLGSLQYTGSAGGDYDIQELIIYPSDQSSNRTGIETNINDFYSIY